MLQNPKRVLSPRPFRSQFSYPGIQVFAFFLVLHQGPGVGQNQRINRILRLLLHFLAIISKQVRSASRQSQLEFDIQAMSLHVVRGKFQRLSNFRQGQLVLFLALEFAGLLVVNLSLFGDRHLRRGLPRLDPRAPGQQQKIEKQRQTRTLLSRLEFHHDALILV